MWLSNVYSRVWICAILFCTTLPWLVSGKSKNVAIRVRVRAGARDCFFVPDIQKGFDILVNFEVISVILHFLNNFVHIHTHYLITGYRNIRSNWQFGYFY